MSFGWIFNFFVLFAFSIDGIDLSVLKQGHPYVLPKNHPIHASLDALFLQSRAILNLKTLKKAGFQASKPRKFTKLIIAKHPSFPGYLFKLYLDAQRHYKDLPEYYYWAARIEGAQLIRKCIKEHHWQEHFKVPHKWIYVLPKAPKKFKSYPIKHTILVEEDMTLFSDKENKALWKSDFVNAEILDRVFTILKATGLYDGAKPDNMPFSIDGKIAFVDTQTFGRKDVRYEKLTPHLSEQNQAYWKALTR